MTMGCEKQDNTFSLLTIKKSERVAKTNFKIVYNCILVHFGRI